MFPACVDNFIDRYADPRTKDYYLASSVWKPITIIVLYLLFVNKIGPWYMKDRKPYNVKKWIILFDISQILANIIMTVDAVLAYSDMKGSFFCLEVDTSNSPTAKRIIVLANAYHIVKLSDMLDTVFFILKGNYRQASYLHVYHHTLMIFFSWFGLKFVPGGHSIYIGIVNSFVHIIMYSYYLLSTINPKFKKNIAFKKFVTSLQLIQFTFLLVMFSSSSRPSCNYSNFLSYFSVIQALYFIYLFGEFYYKSYINVKTDKNQ